MTRLFESQSALVQHMKGIWPPVTHVTWDHVTCHQSFLERCEDGSALLPDVLVMFSDLFHLGPGFKNDCTQTPKAQIQWGRNTHTINVWTRLDTASDGFCLHSRFELWVVIFDSEHESRDHSYNTCINWLCLQIGGIQRVNENCSHIQKYPKIKGLY